MQQATDHGLHLPVKTLKATNGLHQVTGPLHLLLAFLFLCSCPSPPSANTHQLLAHLQKGWELPGLHLHLLTSVVIVFRCLFEKGKLDSLVVR